MSKKQFTTSVVAAAEDESGETAADVTIVLDGREITFAGPDATHALMLMFASQEEDKIRAAGQVIEIMFNLIEDGSQRSYYRRRLLDPKDPLGFEHVYDHMEYCIEEWFARPTESPSGSSPSPKKPGPKSTAKRHQGASTPST